MAKFKDKHKPEANKSESDLREWCNKNDLKLRRMEPNNG